MKQIFSEFMKKMIILSILQLADLLNVTSELRQKSYLSFYHFFIYSYERVRVKVFHVGQHKAIMQKESKSCRKGNDILARLAVKRPEKILFH
jgi:hypothetical protein